MIEFEPNINRNYKDYINQRRSNKYLKHCRELFGPGHHALRR